MPLAEFVNVPLETLLGLIVLTPECSVSQKKPILGAVNFLDYPTLFDVEGGERKHILERFRAFDTDHDFKRFESGELIFCRSYPRTR